MDDLICIEIPNWDKYQVRKNIKAMNFFRVQTNIFSDERFFQLSSTAKLLWFYLLTTCARSMSQQVHVSIKQAAISCRSRTDLVQIAAKSLEKFQLVRIVSRDENVPRVEKSRVEESRGEENKKGAKSADSGKPSQKPSKERSVESKKSGTHNSRLIAYYCESWMGRYKADKSPRLTGKETGILSRIAKSMGEDESIKFMDAYFAMPDSWIVKAAHPVGLMETKKMEIYRFLKSGKFITNAKARDVDGQIEMHDQLERMGRLKK